MTFYEISIQNGKCLAYEFGTKNYDSCEIWDLRKGKKEHKWSIKHEVSAAAVELTSFIQIYEKSINELNIKCMAYIGDDDSVENI